ncbi:NmrA family NAD(P)-binding protein [Kaistella jeonii]|uniref:NmrA family NAD(P)-binding protein n=1 Tax=Kaistella jeonii TaxID=266749 RepID=UPI000AB998E4|nr:NmrA family NAD(P)-binding protein [Kaistella jeonii]
MPNKTIIIASETGNRGGRIIKELLKKDVEVRVLVRSSSNKEKIAELEQKFATCFPIN